MCLVSPGLLFPVTELPSCVSSAITKIPASQDKRHSFTLVFNLPYHYLRSFLLLLLILAEQPVEYVYSSLLFTKRNTKPPITYQFTLRWCFSTQKPWQQWSWEPGAVGAAIEQTAEGSWWFQWRVSVSTRENFFLLVSSWILIFVHAVCNFCGVLSFFKIIYCFVFSKLDQPRYIPHWPCI